MNKYNTVEEWLMWIRASTTNEIDLSLERVTAVGLKLNLLKPSCPVVTVGGTNGKGSSVAALEAIYHKAGYRVGAFTTPYLFSYNEQVRIQGKPVAEEQFSEVFAKITEACGKDIHLTVFEYGTLAAFLLFNQADVDIWILEVGLGGRWDAVNVIDADVAIIASIGLDHMDWLGNTREAIAIEKAGIFRTGKPAVCGDIDPPVTLIAEAARLQTPLFCQQKDFGFEQQQSHWDWWGPNKRLTQLPLPKLLLQNMATVLMAVDLLQERLPVAKEYIAQALSSVSLPGRIQIIPGEVEQVFDVSHNPAAVTLLADYLRKIPVSGKTYAVFSMLKDKDIAATVAVIKSLIDQWYIAPVLSERAASIEFLIDSLKKSDISQFTTYDSVKHAFASAMATASQGDRVIIFGSFRTVAEAGGF